jgi:transaldolase/glucose-6-phosphate isomerase
MPNDLELNLGPLAETVNRRLEEMEAGNVVQRIWERDFTVWKNDPTEITNRLGWLDLPVSMRDEVDSLQAFAAETGEFERIVLLGMGGSSLAPEVISLTFGGRSPVVLDSTHPESVAEVEASGDLRKTLFVVASKSGSTVETLSQLAYFHDKVNDGAQFVAITDPGSSLESLATERGFRGVFLNPPTIGGRYSALSYFGLAPAALIGADVGGLLDSAERMADACTNVIAGDNPGLVLGATIGVAALAGRDKLTILGADEISSLGTWLEQLVAESTGKEDTGIVPIEGEPVAEASTYGADRLFAAIGAPAAPDPSVSMPFEARENLGAEFFRWEFATAVAGHVLGIQPFDQPNVQEAKDATNRLLAQGSLPELDAGDLGGLLASVRPGDYIGLQAYLPRTAANESRLQAVRLRLRDRFRVATTIGFGPRFLHSTGQLHKGGPKTGAFIQIVDEPKLDLAIPGKEYTFRRLLDAQSAGDLEALRGHGRRVARVRLDELEEVV